MNRGQLGVGFGSMPDPITVMRENVTVKKSMRIVESWLARSPSEPFATELLLCLSYTILFNNADENLLSGATTDSGTPGFQR